MLTQLARSVVCKSIPVIRYSTTVALTGTATATFAALTISSSATSAGNSNRRTLMDTAGSLMISSNDSNSNDIVKATFSSSLPPEGLLVPTLEASIRACRLIQTVCLIIMDYELSKIDKKMDELYFSATGGLSPTNAIEEWIHQVGSSSTNATNSNTKTSLEAASTIVTENANSDDKIMSSKNQSNNNYNKRQEQYYWEEETKRRRIALEEAQIEYTSSDTTGTDKKSRYLFKQQQKIAMHNAAEAYIEAQEHLSKIGGDRKSNTHRKAANRLLNLCRTNGGVYIKVGQHLANLDYIIPQEYIDVLSSLFDDGPVTNYDDVIEVIKEDLGKHPDDIFTSFERTPIASASLAQVHVAYDKQTNKKLAIKVQHRGLRETSVGDLFAVTTVVKAIERLFPNDFTFGWIADEICPHLPKELDFVNEGKNSEIASSLLSRYKKEGLDVIIPKVLWKNTSSRVLCMEFEEGFRSTDVDAIEKAGLRKNDVATLISSTFNTQVFLTSFVHCDPHPANVLIRPVKDKYTGNVKPQLVLVDHGLYKQIDDDFRITYAKLWKSLLMANIPEIKESCKKLGVDNEMYTLLSAMLTSRPFDEVIERSKSGFIGTSSADHSSNSKTDKAVIQGYAQQFLTDIFNILGTLPRQMLLLLKMNDCLRHIDYKLGSSPTSTLIIAGTYAARAVYENEMQQHHTNNDCNIHSNDTINDDKQNANYNKRNKPNTSSPSSPLSTHVTSTNNSITIQRRVHAWIDYVGVLLKIRLYDISMWWVDEFRSRWRLVISTT